MPSGSAPNGSAVTAPGLAVDAGEVGSDTVASRPAEQAASTRKGDERGEEADQTQKEK